MPTPKRRAFGKIAVMRSGRYQASYVVDEQRYLAATTFASRADAAAFLAAVQTDIGRGVWKPPASPETEPVRVAAPVMTFGTYAALWLAGRDLKPRTRSDYQALLDDHILPAFADVALSDITPADVRTWYATVATGRPTTRSHAYGLLRTITGTAVDEELLDRSPCRIKGAGSVKRTSVTEPASLDELNTLVMALPPRYRVMALLAAWCAMRFGELTELRRRDVDTKAGIIRVHRGVTHPDGECVIDTPKADSKRNVTLPPHLADFIDQHLAEHCAPGRTGLLFPPSSEDGCHMKPSTLYRVYYPARKAAGRRDLRFHDLRHTGAVYAAEAGATIAELMERLGHRTASAAMRYQHAARGRDRVIADALSERAKQHSGAVVIDITTRVPRDRTA